MLRSDPCLAASPDLSPARLQQLSAAVEQRKRQLEDDIADYIRRKQEQLRRHERQLVEQYRSMECAAPPSKDSQDPSAPSPDPAADSCPARPETSSPAPAAAVTPPRAGPDDTAKRTKHTRVHKREKELYGLITPVFLPLLEAEHSPEKRRAEKKSPPARPPESAAVPHLEQSSSSRHVGEAAEGHKSSRTAEEKMAQDAADGAEAGATKENQKAEPAKKSRRSALKKSSLRHHNAPRSRRKRVSLVIDDQIVLPADSISEPPLTSPSETSASTPSNSTASLDELIDPRLMPRPDSADDHVHVHTEHLQHHDPVHHSLPLSMSISPNSPTKQTERAPSDSPTYLEYIPPQTATSTFLDPAPSSAQSSMPRHASSSPIYADESELLDEEETLNVELEEEMDNDDDEAHRDPDQDFSTYVGGLSGSGVDNVDQAGSYGYPSSLGASYLESYMKSRPLSVRMAAAEKAGFEEHEQDNRREDGARGSRTQRQTQKQKRREDDVDVDEGMEVIGSMEDDF